MKEVKRSQPTPTYLDRLGAFVDRCIYAIAPAWGIQRQAVRDGWTALQRRNLSTYEGAANDNTRGASWIGSRLSPDSALEDDLDSLRNRSRELYRNDCYGGAVDNGVNHVVGVGFTPQCRISPKIVGTEAAEIFREELESVHRRWSPRCDASGRVSLWQQSRLVARHLHFDGEGLAVLSDIPSDDKPIPLTVEVIDPERLETPPRLVGNKLCRMGIEKDAAGRIVAYWIRRQHPGDTLEVGFDYDRVPANRVLHVFERWFAGQSRGLPWLVRALNRIKDCKDLDEAEIISAQVQACFAVFITKPGNPATAAAASATSTDGTTRYEDVKPGAIHYKSSAESIDFANPQRGNGFGQLQEWNYRRIAAGLNVPYEMLVKNWSGTSFAGGRLILAQFRLDTKSRQKLLSEQFLSPVWNRMVDECVLTGQCSIEPRNWVQRPWVYQEHSWTPPAWPYAINPGEEVKASRDAVDGNQRTLASVVAETGEDLEDVLEQRAREMRLQRELEILPPDVQEADAATAAAEASNAKVQGGL